MEYDYADFCTFISYGRICWNKQERRNRNGLYALFLVICSKRFFGSVKVLGRFENGKMYRICTDGRHYRYYCHQHDPVPSGIHNIGAIVDAIVGEDNQSGLIGRLKDAGTGWGRDAFGGISEFIEMLGQFSDAVQTFYEKTEDGKYKYNEGLGNIAQEMLNILGPNNENPDWNMPKITPVLDITQFEQDARKMWNMVGMDLGEDGKLVQANLAVDTSGIVFPAPHDYSKELGEIVDKLTTIDTSTSTFSTDLKNVQFSIDGARLVGKIGPIMDQWLGQEGVFIVRASMTQ